MLHFFQVGDNISVIFRKTICQEFVTKFISLSNYEKVNNRKNGQNSKQ